jgi:outer membrane receptor for ferrienterochelin and colicin
MAGVRPAGGLQPEVSPQLQEDLMRFTQRFFTAFLVVLMIAGSAFAQGTNGALTGTVTNDGVPLPGATVTVSSPSLQGVRTAETDVNGNYNFGALPPGDYSVKVELSGMATVTKTARVGLSQTSRADADLKISSVAETITVTAASPVTAALESTEVQTNVQQKTVNQLPMRRDLQNIGNLAPGVTTNGPSAAQLVISGAPASENLYLVNGAVVNENLRSQIHNLFIEDAIQETTVQTAGISAEYGRFTGGVVSAITKSGGNEFSGSLRDNLENDSWSAMSDYAAQPPRADSLRETYEGTLGGRIIRDRLWFFLAGRYFNTSTQRFIAATEDNPDTPSYNFSQKNERYEAKLTGQLTEKHSLQGSYLTNETTDTNNCFLLACFEESTIDKSRTLPNDFLTAHYNGILTSNWLLEAGYSKKTFAFEGSGGDFRDPIKGTWGYDLNSGNFFGGPVFCGVCDPEKRDNHNYQLKSTYYLATQALGTHNLVAGYDDFAEQRKSDNFQSGSDFGFYTFNAPKRGADGTLLVSITEGDYLTWWPILETSKGSNIGTKSVFVNDKWDFNQRFNFNLGLRYDRNDVTDSAGNKTADDSKLSPRLGLTYDVMGNGRLRLNANYGTYVAHIQESIGGSGASGAGNAAYIRFAYQGPDIIDLPTEQAFAQLFNWFDSVGGTSNADLIQGTSYPGVSTLIREKLTSPSVDEWTLGAGVQLGANAYLRGDYVDRNFHDFYRTRIDLTTGQVTDPGGNISDLGLIENSEFLRRDYTAAILQANYRFSDRFNVGGNYTWSETKANFRGETAGNGPITDATQSYPEYKNFAQNNPYGFIDSVDQTHKLRLFGTYDLPTPVGSFTFGVLERFDSGTPYSAIGQVDSGAYVDAAIADAYSTPPATVNYYFSDRGAFRWDDITATDVSVTYNLPVTKLNLWVKGDLINAFNEQGKVLGSTTLLTAANNACVQTVGAHVGERCAEFNPFTETPVEGVNYQFGSTFGKARSAADYQIPRTVRVSMGIRF